MIVFPTHYHHDDNKKWPVTLLQWIQSTRPPAPLDPSLLASHLYWPVASHPHSLHPVRSDLPAVGRVQQARAPRLLPEHLLGHRLQGWLRDGGRQLQTRILQRHHTDVGHVDHDHFGGG